MKTPINYFGGQGDLVNRLVITPMDHIVSQVIPTINLLAKSPLALQVLMALGAAIGNIDWAHQGTITGGHGGLFGSLA